MVDFFSVTFGLCGLSPAPCDFSNTVREELGRWFREESVTATWIRATSPLTNCSRNWAVPLGENASRPAPRAEDAVPYPAYPTCAASRPDHGSNGAYPSWPAFAVEVCTLHVAIAAALSALPQG